MSQQQTKTAPGLPEKPRFVEGFKVIQDLQIDLQTDGNLIRDLVRDTEDGSLGVKGQFLPGRFAYPTKVNAETGITEEHVATAKAQVKAIKAQVRALVKARAKAEAAKAAEAGAESDEDESEDEGTEGAETPAEATAAA